MRCGVHPGSGCVPHRIRCAGPFPAPLYDRARGREPTMVADLQSFRMSIGGRPVDALSGATFQSENPYTGKPWAQLPDAGPADVDAAVAAARAALDGEWGSLTGFARARLLHRLGDLVADHADRLARLEVEDSG